MNRKNATCKLFSRPPGATSQDAVPDAQKRILLDKTLFSNINVGNGGPLGPAFSP